MKLFKNTKTIPKMGFFKNTIATNKTSYSTLFINNNKFESFKQKTNIVGYNNNSLMNNITTRDYSLGMGFYSWHDDKTIDIAHPSDEFYEKVGQYHQDNPIEDEEEKKKEKEARISFANEGTPLELQQYMKDLRSTFNYKVVVEVSKHCKVTKSGRIFSFSSFMLVGNRNGAAGWGYGRGASAKEATQKAFYDSHRNITTINRDRHNKLVATRVVKYKSCKVCIYPTKRGNNGLIGSQIVQKIYTAFGIEGGSNIRFLKKPRSKNKMTMVKALFKLLQDIKNPQEIAAQVGRQYFDPDTIFRRKYFKHIY